MKKNGYSAEIGHLFRFKSATCSDANRPAVLMQIGHPVGAKRRWFLVLSHNDVIWSRRNVFSHRTSFQVYFMGVMNQAIEDGIGDGRVADMFMPVLDRQLTGNDR